MALSSFRSKSKANVISYGQILFPSFRYNFNSKNSTKFLEIYAGQFVISDLYCTWLLKKPNQ